MENMDAELILLGAGLSLGIAIALLFALLALYQDMTGESLLKAFRSVWKKKNG